MQGSEYGKPLKVRFRVKGNLTIDIPPNGLIGYPIEGFLKLFLKQAKHSKQITRLPQLKGEVEISSPEAALDFVRLRTSKQTWYLMQDFPKERAWAEVLPTGDRESSGYFGECTPTVFTKLSLTKTESRTIPGGFLVRRNIIHDNNKFPITDIFAIEEKVAPDGGYTVLSARCISTKSLAKIFAGFYFPRFE